MSQIKTRRVTYFGIMRSTEFKQGVADATLGRPMDEKLTSHISWNYERGRLFAAGLKAKGMPVPKLPRYGQSRYEFRHALYEFSGMFKDGTII
jgi:hypothetical protein